MDKILEMTSFVGYYFQVYQELVEFRHLHELGVNQDTYNKAGIATK